jgi:DNA-binding IclR family transcriptional regulator
VRRLVERALGTANATSVDGIHQWGQFHNSRLSPHVLAHLACPGDPDALLDVRRRGWAHSVAEREPGVASLSAPVRDPAGVVLGAVSISGPVERLGRWTTAGRTSGQSWVMRAAKA